MNVMPIEVTVRTDTGQVREVNEDSVVALEEHGLIVLADGMGGYSAGEVASRLAVSSISSSLLSLYPSVGPENLEMPITLTVETANELILSTMEESPELQGMATTVVMGLFGEGCLHYAHVGDSRLYRYRAGVMEQMTRDHSMIQEMVDQGMFATIEEATQAGVKNNILVRGLGIGDEVEVDVASTQVQLGDVYLFCSDGLSNMVTDDEMAKIIQDEGDKTAEAADLLLMRALENGGLDNISLALVSPKL